MRLIHIVMIACSVLLSACVDEGCTASPVSPTGTGESGGSHAAEATTTITLSIAYSKNTEPSWTPDSELAIAAGKAGGHTLALQTSKIVFVDGVRKDEAFPVSARGGFLGTCTWAGVTRALAVDLSIIVRPHPSTPDTYVLTCQ